MNARDIKRMRLARIILYLIGREDYLHNIWKLKDLHNIRKLKEKKRVDITTISRDLKYLKKVKIIKLTRQEPCKGQPKKYYTVDFEELLRRLSENKISQDERTVLINGCQAAAKALNSFNFRACYPYFPFRLEAIPFILAWAIGNEAVSESMEILKLPLFPRKRKINERRRSEHRGKTLWVERLSERDKEWFKDNWNKFDEAARKLFSEEEIISVLDAFQFYRQNFSFDELRATVKVLTGILKNIRPIEHMQIFWKNR